MFYYISFLRPPPVQAAPYGTLTIKPQISNDLRTESFQGSQELYYSWLGPNQQQRISKPQKLTTWRPSSAYKDIPVPLPSGVREGEYWRLVLMGEAQVRGHANPESVDLSWCPPPPSSSSSSSFPSSTPSSSIVKGEAMGKGETIGFGQGVPFPVMSMPILFMGRGHKGALKQEEVERTYLVPVRCKDVNTGNEESWKAVLRFVEKTSFDLDKKIWDSGIGLGSWLVELKENESMRKVEDNVNNGDNHKSQTLQTLHDSLFSPEPRRILELGTGIGFVSAVIAVLRPTDTSANTAQSEQEKEAGEKSVQTQLDCILSTDVESAMPLIEQNFSLNKSHFLRTQPKAMVLDWDDEEIPQEVKDLGGLDAIVMADVTYNTASFPSLCRTLSALTKLKNPTTNKHPTILLGYKQRDESEREFWSMMAEAGIEFEKIGERVGCGQDAPVEIWSGRVV